MLDLDQDEILESLADRESGFAYIERKVDLADAERVRQLDLAGIGMLPDSRRIYPQGELAGQVIGTVGIDNQGLTGLEASEDELLHGTDGEREVVRDALGDELERNTIEAAARRLGPEADPRRQPPGRDRAGARRGSARPTARRRDGDRHGPAQTRRSWRWPTGRGFDPSDPAGAEPEELANMATGFTYEPGSTFKAFTVAGALEQGLVTPTTTFDLPPTIQVADRVIEESHARAATSRLSVADILAQSSNVGAVKIGLELGAEASTTGSARSASASRPGSSSRARSGGS